MGQPTGTIIEATLTYTVNSQKCMNILHYVVSTPSTIVPPQDELAQFASDFNSVTGLSWPVVLTSVLAPNATYTGARFQWVFPVRRAFQLTSASLVGAGTYGNCTAQNVAAVVTKSTQLAGRQEIGSFHLGAVGVNGYSAGNLVAPYKTDVFNTVLPSLILSNVATIGGGVYPPILWHKSNTTFNQNYSVLAAVQLQDQLRVMRRRTVGVGI